MRAGAIDGLSIGFRTVRGRTDAKSGVRQLLEVDLWEVSVVTFPMLPAARVSAVKGMGDGLARCWRMSMRRANADDAGKLRSNEYAGRYPAPNPSPQAGRANRVVVSGALGDFL